MLSADNCGGGESRRSIPTPFLIKTYLLVDDSAVDELISWNEDGTAFIVRRPSEFARDLLPKYFKHDNFSSFVRQLNTYGFRKVVPDRWEFANDFFKRGQENLLREIQRRRIPAAAVASIPAGNQMSPANSTQEQVYSSNSSSTATPSLALRFRAPSAEILEENDRLRKENSRLSEELNNLRGLCGNIHNLMSNYATNSSSAMSHHDGAEECTTEFQPSGAVRCGGRRANEEENLCTKIFGVPIRAKRVRRCGEGEMEDPEPPRGGDGKSDPLNSESCTNE